jgi:hypothetical protein
VLGQPVYRYPFYQGISGGIRICLHFSNLP